MAVTACVAAVTIRWLAATLWALANGVHDVDSRHYHLPFAAEFVRTGWLTRFQPLWPDPVHSFHPASSEVIQALGMLVMDRDFLVPVFNLGWLALLLLAGWCAGLRRGVPSLTLLGVAWVASMALLIRTNAGTAGNDVAALACIVAAVALWDNARGESGWLVVAGLALGLALAIKLTTLAAAASLTVAFVVLAPARCRRRVAAVLVGAATAAGGFWYLRNLVWTGNPLPSAHLPPFPSPDLPIVDRFGTRVVDDLFSATAWEKSFWPGLRMFFGAGGVLATGAVAGALVVTRFGRTRIVVALTACAAVALLGYLLLPAGTWSARPGLPPALFFVNLRYLTPALVLVVLAAALAMASASDRGRSVFAACLSVAVGVEVLRHGLFQGLPARFTFAAVGILALAALAAAAAWLTPVRSGWKWAGAAAAAAVLAAAAGPWVARHALAGATGGKDVPATRVYRWAARLANQRIGYYAFNAQYPLYGPAWENELVYVGVHGPRGGFRAVADCEEYVRVLRQERFDYVVSGPSSLYGQRLDLPRWTAAQPNARLVLSAPPYAVFRVAPPYDVRRCPTGPSGARRIREGARSRP